MGFLFILKQLRKKFEPHLKNRAAEWMDAMCASTLLHYPIPTSQYHMSDVSFPPIHLLFRWWLLRPEQARSVPPPSFWYISAQNTCLGAGFDRGHFGTCTKVFLTLQGGRFGTVHKFAGKVVADSINCTHKLKVFCNACNKKWLPICLYAKKYI